MSNRCYLYGAGINCVGVIKFLGKENIVAVIDGNMNKVGKSVEGIPIISLMDYQNRSDNLPIYITAFYQAKSICERLNELNIKRYYKSPYMQMGFFESVEDLIDKIKLNEYDKIAFWKSSPLSQIIAEELKTKSYFIEGEESIEESTVLVVADAVDEKDRNLFSEKYESNKIIIIADEYFEKFRFKNAERCFIIGNAPSLRYEDLELLYKNQEVCFGVNRIYLAYPNTKWRPNYYLAVDYIICSHDYEKINQIDGIKFVRHFYKAGFKWESNEIYEFCGLSSEKPMFSEDIETGVYSGNTVIYDAIQIAAYMGFKEIYLLGVDLDFSCKPDEDGRHFYKSPDKNEGQLTENVKAIMESFSYAAKILKEKGIILRNASRAGSWTEIERVDFEKIIKD